MYWIAVTEQSVGAWRARTLVAALSMFDSGFVHFLASRPMASFLDALT